MSALQLLWMVRTSTHPAATLGDVVYDLSTRRLPDYMRGAELAHGPFVWEREETAWYTYRDEAIEEGIRRLVTTGRGDEERWLAEAKSRWGYERSEVRTRRLTCALRTLQLYAADFDASIRAVTGTMNAIVRLLGAS